MQLRPHQELALTQVRQAIKEGFKKPVIAAPTGFGKTVLAAQILKNCQNKGKIGYFFCDRIDLINQSIKTFSKFCIDFGVIQANHPMRNGAKSIQIVSIKSFMTMVEANNGRFPDIDMAIIDECSTQYQIIKDLMAALNNIPIIGLDATPLSKGLGKMYNKLLVPITHKELVSQDDLCPLRYFVGEGIDLSKVRKVDHNTYSQDDLERETSNSKEILTGCIIKNWLAYGDRAQTISFSPSKDHSRFMVDKFNDNGIYAEHIDCDTPQDERKELYTAHNNGEFKLLSCSRLLGVGYDSPTTRNIIDCYPTPSVRTYVQRLGRIARTSPGKEFGVYLDHAGNFERHGYVEDFVPTELHDGESPHNERSLTNKKEKKELKNRQCPKCYQEFKGRSCPCGYSVPSDKYMEDDGTMLKEAASHDPNEKKANRTTSKEDKARFLSDLIYHMKKKGKPNPEKSAAGWYKGKFGVWPNAIKPYHVTELSDFTKKEFARANMARKFSGAK